MDESTRLETGSVERHRRLESCRLLQGESAIGGVHRLESGWAERSCGFDSRPLLQPT